jgi:hypothetical protein
MMFATLNKELFEMRSKQERKMILPATVYKHEIPYLIGAVT